MKQKLILVGIILILITGVGLFVTTAKNGSTATSFTCTGDFEAGIRLGPDANFSVEGTLDLNVADRAATGTLTLKGGGTVSVSGQVDGRAVNLAFEVSGGKYMFGVGTSSDDFSTCAGSAGGPLAGPQAGDIGDWGYAIGG